MIHASASKIAETIAADREVLLAMQTFLAATRSRCAACRHEVERDG